ncbi:hypothetical protein [Paenibacillus ginsengihumi]|uniref:hypothetical protein n=1 Tax=Paenibacillus ginsengihumi TaxID=431596 RepID=UPI00037AC37F|nr:hypothetical protein [Paenibacillus ginsengihumi]
MKKEEPKWMARQGFYAKAGNDFVGVRLTPDGPKLFVNQEEYELNRPCWDVEMVMGRSFNIVNFYWCGEAKLSIRCRADNELFMPLYDYLSCQSPSIRPA